MKSIHNIKHEKIESLRKIYYELDRKSRKTVRVRICELLEIKRETFYLKINGQMSVDRMQLFVIEDEINKMLSEVPYTIEL